MKIKLSLKNNIKLLLCIIDSSSGHHFPVHRYALTVAKTAIFCHKFAMAVRICAPTFADNRNKVGALTGAFWNERGEIARWWRDKLEVPREGAKILPFEHVHQRLASR